MEIAGKEYIREKVRLKLYRGGKAISFTLSGTIFIKQQEDVPGNQPEYAPVEWVTIMPTRKRMPKAGLFWAALFCAMAFTAIQLWHMWFQAKLLLLFAGALASTWISLVGLVKGIGSYRNGVPTGRIRMTPSSRVLEFLYCPKMDEELDMFFERLRSLKSEIDNPIAYRKLRPPVTARNTASCKESFSQYISGDFASAEASLNQYLEKNPRDVAAWSLLIEISVNLSKFQQAYNICDDLESKGLLGRIEANDIRTYLWIKEHIFVRLDEKDRLTGGVLETNITPSGESVISESRHESFGIKIRKPGIHQETWLYLEGNVLIYAESLRNGMAKVYTPVENVKILKAGRRYGTSLIIWLPIFFLLALPLFFILPDAFSQGNRSDMLAAVIIVAIYLAVIGIFFRFFYRGYPTARVMLEPQGIIIEFNYKPGKDKGIDAFFRRLWYVQRSVNAPAPTRPTMTFVPKRLNAFQRWVFETASLLVLITTFLSCFWYGFEKTGRVILKDLVPYLFLIYPAVRFLRRKLIERKHLKEFLIAARLYEKHKYEEAEAMLSAIVQKYPNYLNAQALLVDVYLTEGKYDDAYESFNAMRALGIISPEQAGEAQEYMMSWKTIAERLGDTKGESRESVSGNAE